MARASLSRMEFTYIKEHGSPGEMVDHALGWIERHIDRRLLRDAEAAGIVGAHTVVGRMSLKEKLDAYIEERVDELEEEDGAFCIWQEVYDILELRPELDSPDRDSKLHRWLDSHGWGDPTLDLPEAPQPLQAELVLHIALDGVMIYLAGWFEVEE